MLEPDETEFVDDEVFEEEGHGGITDFEAKARKGFEGSAKEKERKIENRK